MTTKGGPVTQERVRVRLLGPPAIERDGAQVPVDTRKAIALLAYLVVGGRAFARDHLAALLWPEAPQARARAALRRTLSSLNSALGGRGLRVERESLAFTGEGVDVDLVDFRTAAVGNDPASLSRAAEAYGGDLLAGFTLRDSAGFDEWQLVVSEETRRLLASVLERLCDELAERDPNAAIEHAKRWLELDALHEPAHRALMRLYAAKGDRASALRQYRECVAVLESELGVEPLEETTDLYEAIGQRRAPRSTAEPPGTPVWLDEPPLVGRDADMRQLTDSFGEVGPDGRLIVIGGEPGIGKTRLATEFVRSVRGRTSWVLEVRCHQEEEVLAFGAVIELLRAIPEERLGRLHPDALAEAARLVPSLAGAAELPSKTSLEGPAARRRLLEGVADVIAGSCDPNAPGVVLVDDAHWADGSSGDVLRFLVRRLRGRPLCIVVTWRTEAVPPAHPLRRMLGEALRDGLATGVTLQRLTPADVEEIAQGTGATDEVARTLYEETAGVPFFVVQYLGSGGGRLPAGVRDLLASRVEVVGGRASQVLAAAAVIGRPCDPLTVQRVSGRTDLEVAAALEELVRSGLVAEEQGSYDFTHPKLREYVYESTTLGRKRLLHGRAARWLSRRARRDPELAALVAAHLERAGDEEEAAAMYRAAGDHARGVYANAEALAHYRLALALGGEDHARLHEAMGDLLTLDGRYGEAIASYEKAAALGADISVVGRKLGDVHHRLGEWESAEAHYLEAEQATGPGSSLALVLAERGLNAHRAGRTDDAQGLADRALAEAVSAGDRRARAQAHNVQGIIAAKRGDVHAARDHLEAGRTLAEELADPAATAAALNNLALALRAEGSLEAALDHAERSLQICRRIGDRHREAAVQSNIADILRDLGRADDAMESLKRSAAILAAVDEPGRPHPEVWKLISW